MAFKTDYELVCEAVIGIRCFSTGEDAAAEHALKLATELCFGYGENRRVAVSFLETSSSNSATPIEVMGALRVVERVVALSGFNPNPENTKLIGKLSGSKIVGWTRSGEKKAIITAPLKRQLLRTDIAISLIHKKD